MPIKVKVSIKVDKAKVDEAKRLDLGRRIGRV